MLKTVRGRQFVWASQIAIAVSILLPLLFLPMARADAAPLPTFSVSPGQGPNGTSVSLRSVTPCVPPQGSTDWHVVINVAFSTTNDIGSNESLRAAVSPDGAWATTFTPSTFAPNASAAISATCTDTQGDAVPYVTANYVATTAGNGYWLANRSSETGASDNVIGFGDATSALGFPFPASEVLVGMAVDPTTGDGYWQVSATGGVFTYGDAAFYGSAGALTLAQPIVGMAATPDGMGYWLVASDGGVFSYGNAGFYGSAAALDLNQPIVGMAVTPDGGGYWLVASDGGIFSFGDAHFYGSTGAIQLNQPVVGMAATPDGLGYWLVASDGGIFSFGDARFEGSAAAVSLNEPIVGMARTPDGKGYWLAAADGGVFTYGDAAFYGSSVNGQFSVSADFYGIVPTPVTVASYGTCQAL